jgi:uncharacterized pyridoxamine 5'-phosphate oxidase family protein
MLLLWRQWMSRISLRQELLKLPKLLITRSIFFTGKGKDVFKQLNSNSSVAFAMTTPDFVSVRVSGLVEFTEDMGLKKSLLNSKPGIKQVYQSADNPILALFSIENMEAEIFDMSVMPPRIMRFE